MRSGGRPTIRSCDSIGCVGSIPAVGTIQQILGFDTFFVGFGQGRDRVHSPNEEFELRCYEMVIKSHAAMMEELVRVQG